MSRDRQLPETSNERESSLHLAKVLSKRSDLVRKSAAGDRARTGSPIPKSCRRGGMEIDATKWVTSCPTIELNSLSKRKGNLACREASSRSIYSSLISQSSRRRPEFALECPAKSLFRIITNRMRKLGDRLSRFSQIDLSGLKTPHGEISDRRHADD
jgi:hypothetical protein